MIAEAKIRNLIDFKGLDLRSFSAVKQIGVAVHFLEQEKRLETLKHELQLSMGYLACSKLKLESVESVLSQSTKTIEMIRDLLQPWRDQARKNRIAHDVSDARSRYIAAYGVDPSSAEFKAEERKMIEELRQRQAASMSEESEVERFSRKIREQREGRKAKIAVK